MIQRLFEYASAFPSDVNEHLVFLRDISLQCNHITELGVRNMISTWAFLEGLRKHEGGKLVSVDTINPEGISPRVVEKNAKNEGVDFHFIIGDSHKIELEPTDFLFIDTIHTDKHLRKELELHANKVKKFIGFHDTESCKKELAPVIKDFLKNNVGGWELFYYVQFNNGLTVIKKNG